MNSSGVPANGHSLRGRRASTSAFWSGQAGEMKPTSPYPDRKVSRSRRVMGRFAGTVSSSGLSIVRRTLRSFSSGSHSSTGSSSLTLHSSTRIMAPTAVIGFVVEASRKMVSRRIGTLLSKAMVPIVSTCSRPRWWMSATSPGSWPLSTWRRRATPTRARRARKKPLLPPADDCVAALRWRWTRGAWSSMGRSSSRGRC